MSSSSSVRDAISDTSELYRCSAGNLPYHSTRAHLDEEHKVIFDAALARDADSVERRLFGR